MSNEKQLPPCDAEVFEKGESIGLFPGLEKEDVERLCKGLSAVTGWRIDWSYFAGRPHIRALAPAQQYPGLATAWFDPGYQEFISAQGREATLRIGDGDRLARYSVPLFTGAQAGEVVALRSAILRAGEREHELRTELAGLRQHKTDYMEAAEETRKALLAQLAEQAALLSKAAKLAMFTLPKSWHDQYEALPASTEPSEECAHSYANKDGCPECGEAFGSKESSEGGAV